VRTRAARVAEAKERVHVLGQRLMRLAEQLLPALEAKAAERERVFQERRAAYLAMPRMLRGYFESHRPVLFVHVVVVAFDVGVLHGVLEYSGMSVLTVWITSLTVPLAIAGVNYAFGVVAGSIGLRVGTEPRLKLVALLFGAGLGATVMAFLLLTIFRAEAATAQNHAIQALANGDGRAHLTFFISPIWMGPLQLAGSFAAIAITAFWVAAKHGREFVVTTLAPAEAERDAADAAAEAVRQRIEATHQALEAAALVEHQIDADAEAALVETDALEDVMHAAIDAEDALLAGLTGEYEANYTYFKRIGENGGVHRVAMPTVVPKYGRPYTPGATDAAGSPGAEPDTSPFPPKQPGATTSNGEPDRRIRTADLNHL